MGGVLASIGKFLFGSTAGGLVKAGANVAQVVTQFISTPAQREAFVNQLLAAQNQETASVHEFAAPGDHGTAFDVLVDGINRLIRPFIAIDVLGAWNHWWTIPSIESLSPFLRWAVQAVIVFYFGGRFVAKDLPVAIAALIKVWRK